MRGDARLLVIGPEPFRTAIGNALPRTERTGTDNALAGLWQAGQQAFDGVLLALSGSRSALKVVRSLRRVAPQTRIVVVCSPADEPSARRAVAEGADEYVLEPVTRGDLEAALRMPSVRAALGAAPPAAPSWHEQARFVEVLQHLHEGPQATLQRLAELLADLFEANYVAIELDDLTAGAGRPEAAVLHEPLLRQGVSVGAVAVGRRRHGTYSAGAAGRLADAARLIEAVVTVAQNQQRWQELAWTDEVSQVRNRRYCVRRLDELLTHCTSARAHLTVVLLDVDQLKTYNTRCGYDGGDALLREIGTLLTRCCRKTDLVARYGGDEFVLVLWDAEEPRVPGSRHPSEAAALAERWQRAIATEKFTRLGAGAPAAVSLTGGLASFPWDGTTREQLLRCADEVLLAAKRTGAGRIGLGAPLPADSA